MSKMDHFAEKQRAFAIQLSGYFRGSSMEPRGNPVDSRTTNLVSMG